MGREPNIGFKEWAIVCEALGSGRQSIILRKGGIAEGHDGFRFKHERFFLFPTFFHEQLSKTTLPAQTPMPAATQGLVRIDYLAHVEWSALVQDLEKLKKLAPLHIWSHQVVEERFRYCQPEGVNVAFLRIYKLSRPWEFPGTPQHGGCRSWVELPSVPEEISLTPVLDDSPHQTRAEQLRRILGD